MITTIRKMHDSIVSKINTIGTEILKEDTQIDEIELCLKIKHILEDMQSILDYIAVDIHKKYCLTHLNKKIYFIYAGTNESENDFINRINTFFPGLHSNYLPIYNILSKIQSFSDSSNWLIKLNDLTNEVKHNDLHITEIIVKKSTTFKSENASMLIDGDITMKKHGNGYAVFGTGSIFVGGNGNIGVYGDGNIAIGNGIYNVDSGLSNGVQKDVIKRRVIKSKKYNENIIDILNLIINKENILISDVSKFIS